MNEKQKNSLEHFSRWRQSIAKIHNRPASPINTFMDEETLFIETDGFAWVIGPDGEIQEIS